MKSVFLSVALFAVANHVVAKRIEVVTTTEDLASLCQAVGGERVNVQSLARGYQDPHFVDAKPSLMLKLRKADLFIEVGLDLEVGWAPVLLNGARNPKILLGGAGFLDASKDCDLLERGQKPDRSLGDIHPFGNPHYWTDPENGRIIAKSIAAKLSEISPEDSQAFQKNLDAFEKKLTESLREWKKRLAPYQGTRVVTYHNSWPNFAKAFGLEVANFVEPKPGVPPSPKHLISLIEQMKAQKMKVILMEPYFDSKTPQTVAKKTGAVLATLYPSVGGEKDILDYFALFEKNVSILLETFRKAGAK